MKIRNKIITIIIPIILFTVILFNVSFGLFFNSYLEAQERSKVNSIKEGLSSFIAQREGKYLATVNDWGHWDDTYNYINNSNVDYIKNNIAPADFNNLDINFIFYVRNKSIINQFYYDFTDRSLTKFPNRFLDDGNTLLRFALSDTDTYGILSLGNEFYFVAATDITDSNHAKQAAGRMILGRKIDSQTIHDIEKITGCNHISISYRPGVRQKMGKKTLPTADSTVLEKVSLNKKDQKLILQFITLNVFDKNASVNFTLEMQRDLYLTGLKQILNFSQVNVLVMGFILLIVFYILERYISKPFKSLLKDVKSIDLTKKEFNKLQEYGDGEFLFLRGIINNMLSEIEEGQQEVFESKEKFYATLLSVGDGVIAVDKEGRIEFTNPVAQKLTGWKMEDATGQPIETVFYIINEYTRETVPSPVKEVFEKEEIVELTNHTILIAKDGTERAIEDTAAPIKSSNGKIVGCVLVFKDYSERKEKQRQIEYLSYHDQLTGLYNRRFFEEELKRSDIAENLPISCVYVDLNGLKTFNDAFGHETGDEVLKLIAEVFQSIHLKDNVIARTGGDEFIMLLPKTDQDSVEKLVKRFNEIIKEENIMGINISASFGWDTKVSKEQPMTDILKNAENHMYQKKMLNNSSKQSNTIKSILNTLLIKCPREREHSIRVSNICEAIGQAYHLGDDELNELKIAGELHDIGKIAVDISILNKSGKLTESEWAQIRNHPEIGCRILKTSREFYRIAEYVLEHHERFDGEGYTKGLKGEEILWQSRVIAIADYFDAITCERPYRKTLSQAEAVSEIKKNAGTQFDPDIARVFIEKVLGVKW